jgi:hypothetical protein
LIGCEAKSQAPPLGSCLQSPDSGAQPQAACSSEGDSR